MIKNKVTYLDKNNKSLRLVKFNRNHILIIHREVRSGENFNDLIQILDERSYGRSRIIFAKFI